MPEFRARYEFKYRIDEDQADWIRAFARGFADPDPYGDEGRYTVTSLYLDTWDWKLARQTLEGIRNRLKLRIRTYGGPDSPVFTEEKGRVGTTILKRRARIPAAHWGPLVGHGPPPAEGFAAADPAHQLEYDRFRNTMDLLDLRPRLWVRYEREALQSRHGDGARLTFDRHLRAQAPDPEAPHRPEPDGWQRTPLEGAPTILELKFNDAFPRWMLTLVHQLAIPRVSCSKYVLSAAAVGNVPWSAVEWRDAWTVF